VNAAICFAASAACRDKSPGDWVARTLQYSDVCECG
jgi:hypothetical protein